MPRAQRWFVKAKHPADEEEQRGTGGDVLHSEEELSLSETSNVYYTYIETNLR